ncbi:hypothetical protein OCS_06426 [Ophiocordyceps sinensis CO18]|nr:hypothetical protein OCS_06426 [Ophiocordyceps sinensis CO18]
MYRAGAPQLDDPFVDDVALGEPSSDDAGPAKRALNEKQKRLHRAARLLMQQDAMGVPATMAP